VCTSVHAASAGGAGRASLHDSSDGDVFPGTPAHAYRACDGLTDGVAGFPTAVAAARTSSS